MDRCKLWTHTKLGRIPRPLAGKVPPWGSPQAAYTAPQRDCCTATFHNKPYTHPVFRLSR